MICKPCRQAGVLNKLLPAEGGMQHIEILIKGMHTDCPGGNWCYCHHYVGQVLNRERIEGINAVSE